MRIAESAFNSLHQLHGSVLFHPLQPLLIASFVLDAVGVNAGGEGVSLKSSGPGILKVGLVVYVLAPAVEDVQGEVKVRAFRLDFKRFVDAVSVGGEGVGDPDVAQAGTDLNLRTVLDLPAGVGDLDRIGS